MFIEVIPTSKSRGKDPYTYSVTPIWEDQIEIGSLVEIPFGNDILRGIVIQKHNSPSNSLSEENIRPILSVLSQTPIIDISTLEVVRDIGNRYFLPIHKALSLFVPASLLQRLEKRNFVLDKKSYEQQESGVLVPVLEHYLSSIFSKKDLARYLIPGSVVIFPDDVMLYTMTEPYRNTPHTLFLPNESTQTKRVQAWIDITEGKYEIIVGTRRLLYYNLKAYKHIVYIEDAFGGEQFQYPINIRSLDVLASIAEYSDLRITLVSSSPTLELWKKFPNITLISR